MIFLPIDAWNYLYLDVNSGRMQQVLSVENIAVYHGKIKDSDPTPWIISKVGTKPAVWKLIGGSPIINRGCALGRAERNREALRIIHEISFRETASELLDGYFKEPYPIRDEFFKLLRDEQDRIDQLH